MRECWVRAQAGDGDAAFLILCHCPDSDSYERVTGLPAGQAAPRLQAAVNDYATRLRREVEAAAPGQGLPSSRQLRDFIGLVRAVNERGRKLTGWTLATLPWDLAPAEWDELCDRHLGEPGYWHPLLRLPAARLWFPRGRVFIAGLGDGGGS